MRIGIVCKGETTSRRGFEVGKIGDFGTAAIYKAEVRKCGAKSRFSCRLRNCAAELRKRGILMCAVEKGLEEISRFGISLAPDNVRVFREHAGRAAWQFAQMHAADADFLIIGGSFYDSAAAAAEILCFRRYVYIRNPAFEEIADEIAGMSGAVVRDDAPDGCIELYMCDEKKFLRYGDVKADFSDFEIKLPGEIFNEFSGGVSAQIASMLQISGVLRKKEIKVEYLPK